MYWQCSYTTADMTYTFADRRGHGEPHARIPFPMLISFINAVHNSTSTPTASYYNRVN